jgi:predicted aconitase
MAIKLTTEEKDMLSGNQGRLIQGAMQHLVKLGEAYDARKMIDLDFAVVYSPIDMWSQKRKIDFLTPESFGEAIELGVRVKIPTISGLGAVDVDNWERLKIPKDVVDDYQKQCDYDRKLGIIILPSCDPYLVMSMYRFPLGTHMTSIESSAIPYFNSVLGARANRDGVAAYFGALTGKYPEFGYHLDKNRKAQHIIEVKAQLRDYTDYGILGLVTGKIVGADVPLMVGIERPNTYELVHLGMGVSTGGAVALYHVLGVTPEARSLDEALDRGNVTQKVEITKKDLDTVYGEYSGRGEKVDFVALGCPYYSIYDVQRVAGLLENKRIRRDVSLWIHMDIQTRALARSQGYLDVIEEAGATVVSGTCPVLSAGEPGPTYTFQHPEFSVGNFATDSIKQAFYSKLLLRPRKILLGDMERCIEASIKGQWR